jgi:hypothetical protein
MRNKLFPGITVQTACIPSCEKEINRMFFGILEDYTVRFSKPVLYTKYKINICAVEYSPFAEEMGLTIYNEDENRILIQIKDPFVNECEFSSWSMEKFLCVLAHECVHACQHLTGRNGFKIPGAKVNKESSQEKYFFNPAEVEARALEGPYAAMYGHTLL